MEERQLKEVVGKLHIKKEMEEEILKNVKKAELEQENGKKPGSKKRWQTIAAAAAGVVVIAGLGGASVHAVVNSLVRDRMDSVPQETLEEMAEQLDSAHTVASGYSREFTESEKERQRELTKAYQNGTFPEAELVRVKNRSQIDEDTFCYISGEDCYNIPERELTDEEILQYIDFIQKMDYALQKRYEEEYSDEVQAKREAEQALVTENAEKGGISEEEAIAKAEEWLNVLYGESPDGMEMNSYIEPENKYFADAPEENLVYRVLYRIRGYDSYGLYISGNGDLLGADYSSTRLWDAAELSMEEAGKTVQPLYEKADGFLKDTLGISEEFAEVYCRYFENESGDGVIFNRMNYHFVKEDRMAYRLTFDCNTMEFIDFDYDNYDEIVERSQEFKGETVKLK